MNDQFQRGGRRTPPRLRLAAALMAGFLLCTLLLSGCASIAERLDFPQLDLSKLESLQQTTVVYASDEAPIGSLHGAEDRTVISLSQIPLHVQNAFIAAEDLRFYSHPGIDVRRIIGAFVANIKTGKSVQGASTLTQQLIKLSHLTPEKTWTRKIQEAYLALELEKVYDKNQILEKYLNYVYFGNGSYGIEAAAQGYFDKSAGELTLDEGAMLAGIVKSTTGYAPHLNYDNSIQRRDLILGLMADNGFVSAEEAEEAKKARPVIKEKANTGYDHGYAVEFAFEEAMAALDFTYEEVLGSGYHLYTSLNREMQQHCETLFEDERNFPQSAPDGSRCQSSLVVLGAAEGTVQAMLGGRAYEVQRGLNRATGLYRQPGSAIKPVLVYGPALEMGYSPASMIHDQPMDFNGYTPSNFGDRYYGWVTMRTALSRSLNVCAVKTFEEIGVETGKSYAARSGIAFHDSDLNLALAVGGFTKGVTALMLAGSYLPYAHQGVYNEPSLLQRVEDGAGNIIWERQTQPQQIVSEETAFLMTDMLISTVQTGTGGRLRKLPFQVAAKTGTVGEPDAQGNRDIWTAAYTSELVAVSWMGFEQPSAQRTIPAATTGGTLPALLLKQVLEPFPAPDFSRPGDIVDVTLDARALYAEQRMLLATSLTPQDQLVFEVFRSELVPQEVSEYWSVPQPPYDLVAEPYEGHAMVSYTAMSNYIRYRLYRRTGNDAPVLLSEHTGMGPVSYLDRDVRRGTRYTYFVVPIHPEITISGQPMHGPTSNLATFTLDTGFTWGWEPPDNGDDEGPEGEDLTPTPSLESGPASPSPATALP